MNLEQQQFSLIVVKDYFDGPMSGFAVADVPANVTFFQVVGWDAEHWQRIYAVTLVDQSLGKELVNALAELEEPRKPIWVLGPASVTPGTAASWEKLRQAAKRSSSWSLVHSHDLTDITGSIELSPAESKQAAAWISNETIAVLSSEELLPECLAKLKASGGL